MPTEMRTSSRRSHALTRHGSVLDELARAVVAADRGRRLVPFALATAIAIGGAFLPSNRVVVDLAWSLGALVVASAVVVAGRRRQLWWANSAASAFYLCFVVLLALGEGSSSSGSFSVAMLPVLWVALYGRRTESAMVVTFGVIAIVVLSVVAHDDAAVAVRRAVLWGCMTAAVTIAIHQLRDRFSTVLVQRDTVARQSETLANAVRSLTRFRTTGEVIDAAVRIAAELVSPDGTDARRAVYFVVDGDTATVAAEYDEAGHHAIQAVALADHPVLAEVVRTRQPVSASFDAQPLRGVAAASATAMQVTHGAAVPIVIEDRLHGVLGVGGRGRPIANVERLADLGDVVELALANAIAHEELARQATTDALTGCANRRGLLLAASLLPGRQPYAVMAADLDGLKALNDRSGHDAGDDALVAFADLVRGVIRTGDVVARVGGDEFVVLLHDADSSHARRLACRVKQQLWAHQGGLRASLGIASSSDPADFAAVWAEADRTMYEAKRAGGDDRERRTHAQDIGASSVEHDGRGASH